MAENSKSRSNPESGSDGGNGNEKQNKERSKRGFAAMDPAQQREIARKGGEAVSSNSQHMSTIGKKGGEASRGGKGAPR